MISLLAALLSIYYVVIFALLALGFYSWKDEFAMDLIPFHAVIVLLIKKFKELQ